MAWDPALFVYGTLLVPDVLRLIVGRDLETEPAVLPDHVRRRLHGAVYPGLVGRHGERTEGLLVRGLSREELGRADRFEGELYQRVPCLVETDRGEVAQAFVYVLRSEHGGLLGPEDWDVEHFVREELAAYLEGCRRFAEMAET